MKGLSLFCQGEKISATISNGSLHIIVGQKIDSATGETNTHISFSGFEKDKNEIIEWFSSEITNGDKIVIEVDKVVEQTSPKSIKSADQIEVSMDSKLKTYNRLKSELEEAGLI